MTTNRPSTPEQKVPHPTPSPVKDGTIQGVALPWMAWSPGQRIVIRYRLADGLHDALGQLTEVAPDHVTVDTRRGLVRVEAATMVTGKTVPPRRW